MKKYSVFALIVIVISLLSACAAAQATEVSRPTGAAEPATGSGAQTVIETVVVEKEGFTVVETVEVFGPYATATLLPYPTRAPEFESSGAAPDRTSDYEPVTAGVVDDNESWEEYMTYLNQSGGVWAHYRDVSERYTLYVVDENGSPVHDAEVSIYAGNQWFFDSRTDAGGRLFFHPRATDPGVQANTFTVDARKGSARTQVTFNRYTPEWQVVLPGAPIANQVQLDLLFLLDTTGSMGDEMDKLKATMGDIADLIAGLPEAPDVQYGLVAYKDRGDAYITRRYDFTGNLDAFQRDLDRLEASGGGDYPESVNEALHEALYKMSWRGTDTVRMVILIADAPPHLDYNEANSYDTDMYAAVSMGVKLFPVGASGLDAQGEYIYRQLAQFTGGKFIFLTYAEAGEPASGPGGETTMNVDSYSVQTLDRLIVRLVTEELAKLPEPQQGQVDSRGFQNLGSQGQGNPGLNPANPVWFVPNPGFAPVQPNAWYLNGDFANGLDGWQTGHGSNAADAWTVEVGPGGEEEGSTLEIGRAGAGQSGGTVWLEQPLEMDVTGYANVQLDARFELESYTLDGSGWYCDQYNCEGEYPLRFSVYYRAADGGNYMWSWGFLARSNIQALQNYTVVGDGWTDFTSPNLLNLWPTPVTLTGIRIAGAGWDFQAEVDHLELVVEK